MQNSSMSFQEKHLSTQQIKIFQKMTPVAKLQAAEQLYDTARQLKAAGLRMLHPDWSEEQVQKTLVRIFLYART